MPKIRKIASIERGLEEVVQSLTEEEIKQAINKGSSYVRKCSDPNPDNEGVKRNISHGDSVKLDIKCIEKGISPPLLTAHQFIIDQAKSEHKTNLG